VCGSLHGDFCVTDEASAPPTKDTARLLAAGARKVFWLRVMNRSLKKGLDALLEHVDHKAMLVCESNSLRKVAQPGLFLMVQGKDSDSWKTSAAEVRDCADRVVCFNGSGFDMDLGTLGIENGVWSLKENATAIVLAGGQSRRMGRDKAMLRVRGKPLIEHICDQVRPHFKEVIVSAAGPETYRSLGVRVVPDRKPGEGPLMGMASALAASGTDMNLVVACDIPEINIPFARRMLREADGYDAVVPRRRTLIEPLFAVYRKNTVGLMEDLLAMGERRIRPLYARCKTRFVPLPRSRWLKNLNTKEEYRRYVRKENGIV
jgi:molybdopterin-guanine dinucleotide biosynthesis protein A